jgi:hypothetical protein
MGQYKHTTSQTLFTISLPLPSAPSLHSSRIPLASVLVWVFVEGERFGDHDDDNFQGLDSCASPTSRRACIMLVVVQVTEAARELDDGVGGVLVNGEQVASARTKAGLTVFQAACELLRLPCAVQSSNGVNCLPRGGVCHDWTDCCSGWCSYTPPLGPSRCMS